MADVLPLLLAMLTDIADILPLLLAMLTDMVELLDPGTTTLILLRSDSTWSWQTHFRWDFITLDFLLIVDTRIEKFT